MPKLYFLRGAIGDPSLIEERKEAINRLLRGTYTEGQLEKLKGHDVFSFRLSKKARLLFAIHPIGGASRLVVLDYLPTHDYEGSRFLQSSLLKRYLSQQEHSETPIVFEETIDRPVQAIGGDETQEIDWQVMDYHNQKLIELNIEQQAVMQVRLPALISGAAGSGKSCVALSLLSSWCERPCVASDMRDDDALLAPIVYVSQSRPLVDSMHRSWMDLPLSSERAEVVLFLTYEDLLRRELSADTTSKPLQIIGRDEFGMWYRDFTAKKRQVAKASGKKYVLPDEESAYQEFRILSGCSSQKDYLCLGQRESLVSPKNRDERGMTYAIYQAYLAHLNAAGEIDPGFHSFTPRNKYWRIVVDEAQDFSPLQLIQLGDLAHGSAVFCMDGHQSIHDRRTPRAFVLKHFKISDNSHIQLNLTHRCPERIVTVANQVILLKTRLQGGTGDQYAQTRIDRAPNEGGLGHLFLIAPDQMRDNTWLNAQIGQAHCAIVTTHEHLEAARIFFPTPLVFTPETIKGLEFPVVVAYKLYEPTLFRAANARLQELVGQKEPQHRPKQGCGDERFAPGLSQIYTAYTRAQNVLVVSEENNNINQILLVPLRVSGLAEREAPSEACFQHETFAQDWNQQVINLLSVGNEGLAKTIYISKLKGTEATFDDLVEQRRVSATLKPKPEAPPASAATPVLGTNTFRKPLTALNVSLPPAESVATSSPLPPSPEQSRALIKQRQIAKGVLGLVENFSVRRLEVVMKLSDDRDGSDVWLTIHEKADGTKFCLADLLEDEDKRKAINCCLVNNTKILINKMPYESILKRIKDPAVKTDIEILMQIRRMGRKMQTQIMAAAIGTTVVSLMNYAVYLDDVKSIQLLHQMGADVNKLGGDHETLAFNAALMGRAGVIAALAACGSCLDTPTDGCTPTFIAAQLGFPLVIAALAAGRANLDAPNDDGATPACIAAQNGYPDVITALAAGGADLDRPMPCGATPASIAAQNGHSRVIAALKAAGATIDEPNIDGETPVCIAAYNGQADVIPALAAFRANLGRLMPGGETPARNEHARAITALRAAFSPSRLSFFSQRADGTRAGTTPDIKFLKNREFSA